MKNLVLAATLLFCGLGMAQKSSGTKSSGDPLKFGLKVGINFSNLTNTDDSATNVSLRNGLNIGAYLNYKFADKFAFQPELIYTAQGNIQRGSSSGIDVKATYMLDYIALPLMFKYYPAKNFNVEFGPQLAFIVSKKLKAEGNGQSFTYDLDDFFNDNGINAKTSTFDLALNFGLGYELKNGINFSGRYSLGMIKVFKGADVVYNSGAEQVIKNAVFTLGMGYTFN